MFRITLAVALCLILPACSISPPTSAFSSLAKDEDKSGERATQQVRANAKAEEKSAGIGNSITSAWASVKSGLSFSGDDKDDAIGSDDKVSLFDPQQAQQMINTYRAQQGLRPLRLNPQLIQAAAEHSTDLSRNDRISHFGSDGSDTLERVKRAGYQARLTAENVGTGQLSLEEVLDGWKNSRDHNANLLLSDAEEMGIAMVHAPDTKFKTFWTMVVGAPIRVTN
jgi:uncharacterized protein YkwD